MNYDDVISRAKIPEKFSVNWGGGITSVPSDVMLDNTPITGFKLDFTRGSFDSPNNIQIKDPRGFAFSLPSEAAMQLLLTGNIRDGEILDECVWSFVTPQQPRLLSTSSQVYLTITNPCKVTPRNLKIGDLVKIIGDSNQLVYLGKYKVVKTFDWYYSRARIEIHEANHHVFFSPKTQRIVVKQTPKIFSLDGNDPAYTSYGVNKVNELIVGSSGIYSGSGMVLRVLTDKGAVLQQADGNVMVLPDDNVIWGRVNNGPVTVTFNDGHKAELHYHEIPNKENFYKRFTHTHNGTMYTAHDVMGMQYQRFEILHSDGTVEAI